MDFLSLSAEIPSSFDPTLVEERLFDAGALAVTLTDAKDAPVLEPAPGEVRLWPATRVDALFEATRAPEELAARIAGVTGLALDEIHARRIEDRPWEREWLRDFAPMRFGRRLWVAPHHAVLEVPDAAVVRLDPGLAFGTGTHPTTALCLEWLDAHMSCGARVVDYGCGSGILALAAARLGAARVECFDIDPQALIATRQNAAANGVQLTVTVHESLATPLSGADVLLANILSGPLCDLAPRFAAMLRAGGRVVLAGLLTAQEDEVTGAYAPWFDIARFAERDGWSVLDGLRR